MTPRPLAPDRDGLATAAAVLRAGGLVAFPTETVYGLGVDAFDPVAVGRVFAAKGRPADNPLIVHLAEMAQLPRVVARITPLARSLAAAFWPGPLTLVLAAADVVPAATTGGLSTVAVRVPDHPVATALLTLADLPVAAPSANRSGRPSPTTAEHVAADLGAEVDVILDGGACPVGVESTVVDARGDRPVVLREGTITREDLGLGAVPAGSVRAAELAASPGTRYRHYAPRCALMLAAPGDGPAHATRLAAAGARVGLVASAPAPAGVVPIATVRDVPQLAQRLYAALRDAELAEVDVLVVESVPEVGLGRAVMDRLRRAAS
jgi:L-threonylcarbamoyladenylate synthase